jgi:hypothetical protein
MCAYKLESSKQCNAPDSLNGKHKARRWALQTAVRYIVKRAFVVRSPGTYNISHTIITKRTSNFSNNGTEEEIAKEG